MERNPKKFFTFRITLYSERYLPSSSPQNLYGIIISVEIYICLLSWFSHSKFIESCNPQGYNECSNNMVARRPRIWGFIKELEAVVVTLLNNNVLPDWWKNRPFSVFLICWPLRPCCLERDCHSQRWLFLRDSEWRAREHALCMQLTNQKPIFFTTSSIWLLHFRGQSSLWSSYPSTRYQTSKDSPYIPEPAEIIHTS